MHEQSNLGDQAGRLLFAWRPVVVNDFDGLGRKIGKCPGNNGVRSPASAVAVDRILEDGSNFSHPISRIRHKSIGIP